jgi:uncharacterized protein YbcI
MNKSIAAIDGKPITDAKPSSSVAEQIAATISAFQKQSTGHSPTAVAVVLSEDTLVITLYDALTPAEKALAKSADGAAQVQEFHRQLFATSSDSLRSEIQRITGRHVREAIAEVEPATGTIVHAFTTGTVVQVFLLAATAVANVEGVVGSGQP